MSNLHELKKEIAELEAQASKGQEDQVVAVEQPAVDGAGIADNDPDLASFFVSPDCELGKLFPRLVCTDLEVAKRKLATSRRTAALLNTVRNESLPIEERVDAAVEWRAELPAGNRWESLNDDELVERISIHPHWNRLKEISSIVCGPDGPPLPGKDRQKYISYLKALIDEFQSLRNEYPKREAPVMLSLEDVLIWAEKWNSSPKDDYIAKPERTVEDPKASVKELTAIYNRQAEAVRQQLAELQKTASPS